MIRPTEVEPREGVPDMASVLGRYGGGGIDLSHLAGRGVFKDWNDRALLDDEH